MNLVEYTEFIIKSICKKPDMVKVIEVELTDDLMIEIIVDKEDLKTVIGKSGNTINAVKTILRAKSYIDNTQKIKVNVDSI